MSPTRIESRFAQPFTSLNTTSSLLLNAEISRRAEFARFAIDNPSFRFSNVFVQQKVRIPYRMPEYAIEDAMIVSPPVMHFSGVYETTWRALKSARDNIENGEVDEKDGAIHGMRPLSSSSISITHGVRWIAFAAFVSDVRNGRGLPPEFEFKHEEVEMDSFVWTWNQTVCWE